MTLRYHLLDVFTDCAFRGNPLAVFPDAPPLECAHMQAIACELNLSETVFVFDDARPPASRRMRIFTSNTELPFAGHPTVGTAALLADLGLVAAAAPQGLVEFNIECGIGMLPVTVRREGALLHAQFTAALDPSVGPPPPPAAELAAMLGLRAEDIASAPIGPCNVTAGLPDLVVPLREPESLQRVASPGEVRTRMFAPGLGAFEDPATGSAAVAVAAWLVQLGAATGGVQRWSITQGVEMGRPSLLELEFEVTAAGASKVRLGGSVVRIGEGVLYA